MKRDIITKSRHARRVCWANPAEDCETNFKRPPGPVAGNIYAFARVMVSFSPFVLISSHGLLCLAEEEPRATPFELLALLLLLLPLVLTFLKFVVLFAERSHQLLALLEWGTMVQIITRIKFVQIR